MSYIDAKWEEPNLRTAAPSPAASRVSTRRNGVAAWLSRQIDNFVSWRRDRQAATELALMSDHELGDIGLTRADIGRVFQRGFNADLQQRGFGG